MEKHIEYAVKIQAALADVLSNEENQNFIDINEFQEGENLNHFFHALASVAPCSLFNKITGTENNQLEFNHIANHLCFQFNNKEGE